MRIEALVWDLHSRGIVLEPAGNMLAVDPIEKLKPAEIEAVRKHKQEILKLFKKGRLRLIECPGDSCHELLLVLDGETYCNNHGMNVRFIEGPIG